MCLAGSFIHNDINSLFTIHLYSLIFMEAAYPSLTNLPLIRGTTNGPSAYASLCLPTLSLPPLLKLPQTSLLCTPPLQFFRPLGVRVALVGLEIWNDGDKIRVDDSPADTLDRFLDWRGRELLPRLRHDNAQLVL